jgi:hypothetical protein
VEQAVLSPLKAWESFYVIIGSSGAALTGLQFVVMTLSAKINAPGGDSVVGAFSTPTICPFLRRPGHRGDPECALVCALKCRPRSWCLRCSGADLRGDSRYAYSRVLLL